LGERAGRKYGPTREQGLNLAGALAGRAGGLERPADVVNWLRLIGLSVTAAELDALGTGERWRAELASAHTSRYQVPSLPITHVERTTLMARARTDLLERTDGGAPLVLAGMAGTGKSTLAAALAQDPKVRARLPHGVLWTRVTLPPGEAGSVMQTGEVLRSWARALGLEVKPEEAEEELSRRLVRWLAEKRALLVIDGARAYDEIQPLLVAGPDCRIVITTRNRGLVRDLPAGSPMIEVGALGAEEAEQLLVAILGEKAKGLERALLQEMVSATEGNALALEIAGKDAKAHGVAHTLADLRDPGFRLQVLSPRGVADPNRSVAASFALSYSRSDPQEQRCYRQLGQMPGAYRFTVEMYRAAAEVRDRRKSLEILRGFVDRSLLQVDGEGYRLHPLLFEYARWLLEEAGEWDPEHAWVERYEGEWVKTWRYLWPSVPRVPGATVEATGGLWQWVKEGVQELIANFRRPYQETIVEGWDPQNVPLERWIALTRLKRRQRTYIRGALRLGAVIVGAAVVLLVQNALPMSWLMQAGVPQWFLALASVAYGVILGGVFLAAWLGTVLMIDLHRLRNWG
jgi:hypothetical protein